MSCRVKCPHCRGTGEREMRGVLGETLALLRSQPVELHGGALARIAGIRNSAMCSRLKALEERGLAASRKERGLRFWRAL